MINGNLVIKEMTFTVYSTIIKSSFVKYSANELVPKCK